MRDECVYCVNSALHFLFTFQCEHTLRETFFIARKKKYYEREKGLRTLESLRNIPKSWRESSSEATKNATQIAKKKSKRAPCVSRPHQLEAAGERQPVDPSTMVAETSDGMPSSKHHNMQMFPSLPLPEPGLNPSHGSSGLRPPSHSCSALR